jgi:hypothetical protein
MLVFTNSCVQQIVDVRFKHHLCYMSNWILLGLKLVLSSMSNLLRCLFQTWDVHRMR